MHILCFIDSLNYQLTDVFVDAADSHNLPKASVSEVGKPCRPHSIQLHIYLQRGCAVQRLEQASILALECGRDGCIREAPAH